MVNDTRSGKIYVIVTDDPDRAKATGKGKNGTASDKNELTAHWARQKLLNEAKSLITTAVLYNLSNIGNFTGDYITQTHMNDGISIVQSFMDIGTATIAGAHYGPIGAIVGASFAIINKGVNSILSIHSNRVQNNKTNYEIAQLRNRSGLNATMDGSRGTEN